MNNTDFIRQFSILPNKYIILYVDDDVYNEDINNKLLNDIKNINSDLNIIRFLSKNDSKQNLSLTQIYPDFYTEDILIKNCLCVLYISKNNRSENLISFIETYNKYVIYEEVFTLNIINDIYNNDEEKVELLKEYKNNFKNIYESLTKYKNMDTDRNIKLEYNKILNDSDINIIDNKITVITYFKNLDINILNVIQKKCIIENVLNKHVFKVIVLGNNISDEFKDMYNENLQLIELDKNVSYKDLLDIANKLNKESIVCILRSDIVLPNQNELEDLHFELSSNNEIYTLSRIERLINGNLIKSPKLNKTLFSSELDAWIFKSPINIDVNIFDNIYFYTKYSELYFNKLLIDNGYTIINNSSKLKIIRILYENNIENRLLLDNENININDVVLIPDNEIIKRLSIDNLLNIYNISNDEINNIKHEIFNKYLKTKIISEIFI